MLDKLPLVSIVTPSYNQAEFLEATIISVLNQDYPNIEYVIIDGGSTDGSVEIIRKYEKHLSYWVSNQDHGQSDAINKGFEHVKGDIVCWLNSDDQYTSVAVRSAVEFFLAYPDIQMIYGDYQVIDETENVTETRRSSRFDLKRLIMLDYYIPQPTVFLRQEVLNEVGPLDVSLHYAMDYDWWLKISLKCKIRYFPKTLAKFRYHSTSKSTAQPYQFAPERHRILEKFFSLPDLPPTILSLKDSAYFRNHCLAVFQYCQSLHVSEAIDYLKQVFGENALRGCALRDLCLFWGATPNVNSNFDIKATLEGYKKLVNAYLQQVANRENRQVFLRDAMILISHRLVEIGHTFHSQGQRRLSRRVLQYAISVNWHSLQRRSTWVLLLKQAISKKCFECVKALYRSSRSLLDPRWK